MNMKRITVEQLLYGGAFLLALLVRLLFLGAAPLSDAEATNAMHALSIARGQTPLPGSQPGYVLLTAILFIFSGSTNFLARFWPALSGSLFVLAPFLFRDRLGKSASWILAFALALDPGLVAISRQAEGTMMAISFLILASGFFLSRKPVQAGVATGLALLGGPAIWSGSLGLGLVGSISRLYARRRIDLETSETPTEDIVASRKPIRWSAFFIALLVTLVLVGTLCLRVPVGLGALADSLAAFFAVWGAPAQIPFTVILAALVCELLPLVFGIWGMVRSTSHADEIDRFLAIWFWVAFLIAFVLPTYWIVGLGWAIVALWTLAARELSRLLPVLLRPSIPVWIEAVLLLIIAGFIAVNFTGLISALQNNLPSAPLRGYVMVGALLLLLVSTILVAWGWTYNTVGAGLLRGGAIVLSVYTIAVLTATAGYHSLATSEPWYPPSRPEQADLLLHTVGDLSWNQTGNREGIEVVVAGVSSKAIEWAFRDFPKAQFIDHLDVGVQAPIVITPQEEQPSLAAAYRGEGFLWNQGSDWSHMSLLNGLNWLAYHQLPQTSSSVIVWARADIFPGGTSSSPSTGTTP